MGRLLTAQTCRGRTAGGGAGPRTDCPPGGDLQGPDPADSGGLDLRTPKLSGPKRLLFQVPGFVTLCCNSSGNCDAARCPSSSRQSRGGHAEPRSAHGTILCPACRA